MLTTLKTILITVTILCGMFVTTPTVNTKIKLVVAMEGVVRDFSTKKPTCVVVSFYDKTKKKVGWSKSNSTTGKYHVSGLKPGEYYTIKIESFDYIPDSYDVILPNVEEYTVFEKDFEVLPRSK